MLYRRLGFECEILLIANCEFLHKMQSKESQEKEYATNNVIRDLLHAYLLVIPQACMYSCRLSRMSLLRFFKPTANLPTP